MFGYVTANAGLLSEEEKIKYRACYCGLCRALKKRGAGISLLTLNYDMAFLILILESLYPDKAASYKGSCGLHPFGKKDYSGGEITEYAADMNIILSGYKMADDIKDENKISAKISKKIINSAFDNACAARPGKAERIKEKLDELSKEEEKNSTDPDKMASVFGKITAEMFSPYDDENRQKLYDFGDALGKFIYIMDACMDLKKDIRRKRYNPLILYPSSGYGDMLNLLMADCTSGYEALGITENKNLIENILFSGIWIKYELTERKKR